jgi:hypothetical protein
MKIDPACNLLGLGLGMADGTSDGICVGLGAVMEMAKEIEIKMSTSATTLHHCSWDGMHGHLLGFGVGAGDGFGVGAGDGFGVGAGDGFGVGFGAANTQVENDP